ncbi:hypothetical protein GL309_08115 [Nocardia seriolae]|nr:hypothetical protein [Nocardia seriolae]
MSPRTDVEAAGNFLVPNGPFFAELLIFLIVLAVIWFFVVPPIRKVLAEREARVEVTTATAKQAGETHRKYFCRRHERCPITRPTAPQKRNGSCTTPLIKPMSAS